MGSFPSLSYEVVRNWVQQWEPTGPAWLECVSVKEEGRPSHGKRFPPGKSRKGSLSFPRAMSAEAGSASILPCCVEPPPSIQLQEDEQRNPAAGRERAWVGSTEPRGRLLPGASLGSSQHLTLACRSSVFRDKSWDLCFREPVVGTLSREGRVASRGGRAFLDIPLKGAASS